MNGHKKLFIAMSFAFIVALSFTTCDRRITEENADLPTETENLDVKDFELLYHDIKQLTNDQIIKNGVQTRGLFGKILACVLADGLGFWAGGLDGAVRTSAFAYGIASMNLSFRASSNSQIEADAIIPESEQGINLDKGSAGYIHNLTIENVYKENGGNRFFELSEKEQSRLLLEKSKEIQRALNYTSKREISENEVDSIAKTISQALEPNMTRSEYATKLKEIYNSEESKVVIDITSNIISGLENSFDDREEYIKKVEDAIENSSLSKENKLRLNDVVSVTYASSALWNSRFSSR
jgi:hypothetical protein